MSSLQGSEARLGNEESIFGGVDPFIMLDSFKEGQGREWAVGSQALSSRAGDSSPGNNKLHLREREKGRGER